MTTTLNMSHDAPLYTPNLYTSDLVLSMARRANPRLRFGVVPYDHLPDVGRIRTSRDVTGALAVAGGFAGEEVEPAYVFAVARSYMAEKYARGHDHSRVHSSVTDVERKLKHSHPHYLKPFHQARKFFELPSSVFYLPGPERFATDPSVVRALEPEYDAPPPYEERPHCSTCTCHH